MNGKKLLIFSLTLLSCFLLVNNVQSQCEDHTPIEWGKNLETHMIANPPVRWTSSTVNYQVNIYVSFWYGTDITQAKNVWNNSAYKEVSTAFRLVNQGGTTKSPEFLDGVNVIGFKNLGPDVAARARIWFYTATGKIVETDMSINSLSWWYIQPHDNAGPTDFCVREALVHEFGHWIHLKDLYHHQSVEYLNDTMYWKIYKGEHKKEDLECDDRWGIWYTYDSGHVPPPAPSLPPIHTTKDFVAKDLNTSETRLLRNYPNPFNPETWIPYTLSEESNVTLRIYNTSGEPIRTIFVGRKKSGVYIDKKNALYWDGKTDSGEKAANGVYFYNLLTDKVSLIRNNGYGKVVL